LEFIDHYDQPAPNRNDQPGIRHGDLSAPGHSDREAPNHDERGTLTRKNQPEILHMDRPDLDRPPLHRLRQNWPNATFRSDQEGTGEAADLVFGKKGGRVSALVPGTRFQIKVWEALLQIPFGGLATYSDIASKIGQPGSGRAVGTAIGSNQIAYLIPCHRVIRSMGLPGGYRWGTGRKLCMIGYENALSRSSVNA
ncbi:MAG: methylated-DNA--[protein]-cysteine S-methyltransferase, partial [Bacteroidetes bacterium]